MQPTGSQSRISPKTGKTVYTVNTIKVHKVKTGSNNTGTQDTQSCRTKASIYNFNPIC